MARPIRVLFPQRRTTTNAYLVMLGKSLLQPDDVVVHLDRPVPLPRSEFNAELAAGVGAAKLASDAAANLSAREWDDAGAHVAAYQPALQRARHR